MSHEEVPQTAERLVLMYFPSQVASEFDALRQPNWVVIDASQSIDDIHKQVHRDVGSVCRSSGVTGLRGWCTPTTPGCFRLAA